MYARIGVALIAKGLGFSSETCLQLATLGGKGNVFKRDSDQMSVTSTIKDHTFTLTFCDQGYSTPRGKPIAPLFVESLTTDEYSGIY